ncbi:hypothetical protein SUGI_1078810 [Cryptomeria japonica]|uniref:phenylcoumaran benzylic ether reductase TP7 n=1 Tax=Cryptomeria japonica TaxID=3369 RepID=UPI0024149C82|nr:phenylcoumaran benzylic ether reductase TP7 [Cryptomeria japonica]GLJ50639.1 hypothetical protein SUGI_1078810 [Cryptomeria japonica]
MDGNIRHVDLQGKSRVLIFGATGYMGHFIAMASLESAHPTFAFVRPSALQDPVRAEVLSNLRSSGIHIIAGSLEDPESLVRAIQGVDVVISLLGGAQIMEQLKIIDAIKEVGTVKRFLPSEFGHDVDRAEPIEPALSFYETKRRIRRATEEAKIGYTYICCNSIAGWPYHYHTHPSKMLPPTDKIHIYGDGNIKAYFMTGRDIGSYTVRAIEDPRALNKKLHFRPADNFLTMNELSVIWQKQLGKKLPVAVISEEDLLKCARANVIPASIVAAITHDIFIKGCQFNFSIEGEEDEEACQLYPDIKYTKLEDYFSSFSSNLQPEN